ncbi:hypothetical protein Pcinc_028008 [Petrolisthes cinctipes]|uniref:Uncharacterized protein n=1 Tax=Petrolisthes cinctipes TaxID=88211 RepID=A0AAE1F3V5_PETCI|nr:hypothetical protein Pcinc_028008 [Petrolisthes cinctipes]
MTGGEEGAGEATGGGGGGEGASQRNMDLPVAGKEKHGAALDFPGVRFADDTIATKPQQETQVVIESLRENKVEDVRPCEAQEEVVEVDWLGVPLATSTLPDYTSMYRHHYPHYPHSLTSSYSQRTLKEEKKEREIYEQFDNVGWVRRDTLPRGLEGGYVKMGGQVGRALLHPQGNCWNTPSPVVQRLRRTHPTEYFNLCDPNNQMTVERMVYQWTLRDQAAVDERATVGRCARSSGFTRNSSPHLPPHEDRNFVSVYSRSYNVEAPCSDVEGLHPSVAAVDALQYPGYGGSSTMDDTPNTFFRMTPHVLKTQPSLLSRPPSHALRQAHKDFTNS